MERQQVLSETLIRRAREGDRDAQNALWKANRRWVAAIVLAHRPHELEVDDLMQDVAVKLISRIDTLRDPEAFRPWLRQIVINVCRGAARGLRPTLRLAQGDGSGDSQQVTLPAGAATPADHSVDDREAALRVYRQALSLPPEYREPLLLRCLRSLSYQQIGEILDLPVTTIETRLARARRMMREEVGEALGEMNGREPEG